MKMELDHLFVCTSPGAPEAEKLVQLGLHEGPPNQHPGQGTACRRFSFANAMIELFWVSDPSEAQSECTKRTLLWERWSGRQRDASPFCICVRPVNPQDTGAPFPASPRCRGTRTFAAPHEYGAEYYLALKNRVLFEKT